MLLRNTSDVPIVTIGCITYNHEKFLREALESFVNQKTDFSFEVIIADDKSTDGTAGIIKEYEEKYPRIIRPIYRQKNLGVMGNFLNTLSEIHSRYVVYCEGDDYFTDPYKLQKQVVFLETHPECSICFHPTKVIFENSLKPDEVFPAPQYRFNKTILTLEDLLIHNFIQTNSAMYRWRFVEENILAIFPANIMPGDHYLHLLHAQKGYIAFLDDVMTVYRRHENGIWWTNSIPEELHLKYGLEEFNFFVAVYKNITKNPEIYLIEKLMPIFKYFSVFFMKNERWEYLELLFTNNPKLAVIQYIGLCRKLEKNTIDANDIVLEDVPSEDKIEYWKKHYIKLKLKYAFYKILKSILYGRSKRRIVAKWLQLKQVRRYLRHNA